MSANEALLKSKAIWDEMAAGWEKRLDYIWATSRPVGEWMIEKIDPQPGQTILEIAAGPGTTGFIAAKLVGEGGKLICTDFSPEMIEVAQREAAKMGLRNIEFRVMDAEKMELDDDSVDGVLCRWGYMLMIDSAAALAETRRVLRPGGRAAFSVWGAPADNPWAVIPGMVMVQLGKMEPADPNAPGGIFSMAETPRIEELVRGAGFDSVEIVPMQVNWGYDDFDQLWSFTNELAGALRQLLMGLDEKDLNEVKEAMKVQAENYRTEDGYLFPGKAINVVAQ